MFLILAKMIGIYFCIYGSSDHNYPEDYKQLIKSSLMLRFQYLTNIGLELTTYTLLMGIFHQIIARVFKKDLRYINFIYKNLLLVILPIEIIITIVFWSLFLYDPKVIVTKAIYDYCGMNLFQNICIHLIPAIFLMNEAIFLDIQRSNLHIIFLVGFGLFYYLFVRKVANDYKKWPYPFLDDASENKRILIFTVITLLSIFIYELCIFIFTKMKKKIKRE